MEKKCVISGQLVQVKVCKPSRRKAASKITKPKYQQTSRGAVFVARDNGQIDDK